jgi:hypothetical protein
MYDNESDESIDIMHVVDTNNDTIGDTIVINHFLDIDDCSINHSILNSNNSNLSYDTTNMLDIETIETTGVWYSFFLCY